MREKLRAELEAKPEDRRFGTGWLAGTIAFLLSVGCLVLVITRAFPGVFVTPELRVLFDHPWFGTGLFIAMLAAFGLALVNLALRPTRILGLAAIAVTLLAGSHRPVRHGGDRSRRRLLRPRLLCAERDPDWACCSCRSNACRHLKREQRLFRAEWREDLFYYFVSSLAGAGADLARPGARRFCVVGGEPRRPASLGRRPAA